MIARHAAAVRFEIGFIHDVKPKLRRDFVKGRMVGVMRTANGVEAALLDEPQLVFDAFDGDGSAVFRVVFVTVDALDINRRTVDKKPVVLNRRVHHADALGMRFDDCVALEQLDR